MALRSVVCVGEKSRWVRQKHALVKKEIEEERAIKLRKDKTTNHHYSKLPRNGRNEQFACSNTLLRKPLERQSSADGPDGFDWDRPP